MAFNAHCYILKYLQLRSSTRPAKVATSRTTPSPMELTVIPESSGLGQPSDYQQSDQTDGLDSKGATVGDQHDVLAMQIEPVFHRRFDLAAVVALGMSVVVAYQNTLATLGFTLYNGGTGGVFFGHILVIIGFTPVYASLAELSSW